MSNEVFDCVSCGACCFSRNPKYLRLLPEDKDRDLPDRMLFQDGDATFMTFACGRCVNLTLIGDQAICQVYENRPEACRTFRAGSFECVKARRANGILGQKVRSPDVAA